MELRELRGDDLFTMLGIVGKLDIKDEFVRLFENNVDAVNSVVPLDHAKKQPTKKEVEVIAKAQAKQEAEVQKRGMAAAASILQNLLLHLKDVKSDVNDLLADLTGESKKTIEELGLKEYTALIIQFFKKPELSDFFTSIASLLA